METVYIILICSGCVLAVLLAALFVLFSNNKIKVTKYACAHPKIPEGGIKIVHVSDLHAKEFGKGNFKLFEKVKEQAPDFIAITGDIIHKYRPRDVRVAVEAVRGLSSIAPVYYVSGNHEMRDKEYRYLRTKLTGAGAVVLDDKKVTAFGIDICGVNCASIKAGRYSQLSKGDNFKLLLAHLPHYIKSYSAAGYDIALCGHAHGGQWRLPFTRIGIYAPGQGFLPKYTSGIHESGDMKEIISRGLGNSEFPLRLFNRPELAVIELNK